MIIIVSWYSDGSGKPDVVGIPKGDDWMDRLFETVHELSETGKEFQAYRVDKVEMPLVELGLGQAKESNG